jgi:hypothetical protein
LQHGQTSPATRRFGEKVRPPSAEEAKQTTRLLSVCMCVGAFEGSASFGSMSRSSSQATYTRRGELEEEASAFHTHVGA